LTGMTGYVRGMMSPSQSDREDEERNIDRPHSSQAHFFSWVFS
jgi:hypothetical protein